MIANHIRENSRAWKCTWPHPRQVAPCLGSSWTFCKVGVPVTVINIAHMAHMAPLPCAHTPLHAQKMSLCYRLEGRGGGCGRHDEIYLIPDNILMIPTRPPPPPFKIWWGMFVEYFLLERVMFEFADKLSLFGRNRKRNKKDESSTLFALYYSPSPVWEVSFFFNVGYKLTSSAFKDKKSSVLTYHRIIEAFKFSYAWRSLLGDPYFNSDIKVGGNHSVVQIMPVFTFYQSEGSYR